MAARASAAWSGAGANLYEARVGVDVSSNCMDSSAFFFWTHAHCELERLLADAQSLGTKSAVQRAIAGLHEHQLRPRLDDEDLARELLKRRR